MRRRPSAAGADRSEPSPEDGTMTLTEHLAELRLRIIRAALAVLLGAIGIIIFYDQVLRLLTRPYRQLCVRREPEFCGLSFDAAAGEPMLFALDPLEGLRTRMGIAMYGGIVLAIPVIMWQVWRFVVPALKANEKRYAVPFILTSVALFLTGGVLAYFTLERALEFLISWAGSDIQSAFRVGSYVSLVGLLVAAFGIGFQTPVLLVFLQLVGVLEPQQLFRNWRYALVGIVVVSAAITPTGDPISLALLSVPMTALYFAAGGIGVIAQRRAAQRDRAVTPA